MLKGGLRKLGLVVVLIVVVAAGTAVLAPGRRTEANAASLSVLHGGVDGQRTGASAFGPAFDGDLFASGDALRADDAGNGVLNFFDGSTLSVESGTQVKVARLSTTAASKPRSSRGSAGRGRR